MEVDVALGMLSEIGWNVSEIQKGCKIFPSEDCTFLHFLQNIRTDTHAMEKCNTALCSQVHWPSGDAY